MPCTVMSVFFVRLCRFFFIFLYVLLIFSVLGCCVYDKKQFQKYLSPLSFLKSFLTEEALKSKEQQHFFSIIKENHIRYST